jgi:muconolactone delta-isomerase
MQFLTVSRRRTECFTDAQFAALAEEEFLRVGQLHAQGHLRYIWRRTDIPGACAVWEADSEESLRALISSLPLAKSGMLEIVSIVPLQPYNGFGPASGPIRRDATAAPARPASGSILPDAP